MSILTMWLGPFIDAEEDFLDLLTRFVSLLNVVGVGIVEFGLLGDDDSAGVGP